MSNNKYENFDYNIEQLTKPVSLKVIEQDTIMNSKNFNDSMQSIEDGLNTLYEKTRYLEESIEYAKTFLNQKIDNYRLKINNSISSIEDIKKINRNMGYLDYVVPFQENKVSTVDRDKNYKIESCMIMGDEKVLTLSERIKEVRKCTSYVKKCAQTPYDSNFNDLIKGEKYRSIYIEDKPIQDGITENVLGYLPYTQEVNSINIKTVNSKLTNITFVYPNGIEESLSNQLTGINNESRMITHFKFAINCSNYDVVEYELDEELAKADNIWNSLKEFEYNLSVDKETKIEVDALIKRTVLHTGTGLTESKVYKASTDKTIKITKYMYTFGIDNIDVSLIDLQNDSYFISENINIGTLNETEYIQLDAIDNSGEYSNIEYSIIDGDLEIPIIPINQKYIYNERIFPENNLRFAIDDDLHSKGIIKIKKDGMAIDTELSNIIDQYDAKYCVSYQPTEDGYKYTPLNDSIKIKASIRTYGSTLDTVPYIKNIIIKKHGGNTLWTNVY